MIGPYERPNFQEINTPWEPQEIAWQFFNGVRVSTNRYMQMQLDNPDLQYIVREVEANPRKNDPWNASIVETLDHLALADEQFRQLEALTDIKVAPTSWHVFSDKDGLTRTLARVSIVNGGEDTYLRFLTTAAYSGDGHEDEATPWMVHAKRLKPYYDNAIGNQLDDIDKAAQYKLGTLRDTSIGHGVKAIYLVDIEPILFPPTLSTLPDHVRGERIT